MTSWNSAIEPGQPWVRTSGVAPSCGERTWSRWMSTGAQPSTDTEVVNCGKAFRRASRARQS